MSAFERLFDIASFATGANQCSLEDVTNSSEGDELKGLEPPELVVAPLPKIQPPLKHDI